MKVGHELDSLIAERVLGLEVVRNTRGGWSIGPADYYDSYGELILANPLPAYSTDISAAWEVLSKYPGNITLHRDGKRWFILGEDISTDTAPEAICRAALKAVGLQP